MAAHHSIPSFTCSLNTHHKQVMQHITPSENVSATKHPPQYNQKGLQAINHVSSYTLPTALYMGLTGKEIAYNLLYINIFIIQLFTRVE